MASEAAILGTPSIYVSSLAGTMGNFIELEETYDLLYSLPDGSAALGKAIEILQDPASKEKWRSKRKRLLADKIDGDRIHGLVHRELSPEFYRAVQAWEYHQAQSIVRIEYGIARGC